MEKSILAMDASMVLDASALNAADRLEHADIFSRNMSAMTSLQPDTNGQIRWMTDKVRGDSLGNSL